MRSPSAADCTQTSHRAQTVRLSGVRCEVRGPFPRIWGKSRSREANRLLPQTLPPRWPACYVGTAQPGLLALA